jgi:peptide-methionine (S)-S-oxide reductase
MTSRAKLGLSVIALTAAIGLPALVSWTRPAEAASHIPPATLVEPAKGNREVAVLAGGCFWGVEAVFSHMKGVRSAVSGYEGGSKADADYKAVSSGGTAHRESVKVVYDPKVVRYDQLLRVFFSVVADPTLKNNQGPDHGPQYDAALVPLSAEQRAVATAYLAQMKASGKWGRPIVTGVVAAKTFYPAEDYHQDFAKKNPNNGYIKAWDAPKVAAFKKLYPSLYRESFQTG